LKAPGPERLKLEYEEMLSNFGFKFNLRRYTVALHEPPLVVGYFAGFIAATVLAMGRGLHLSTIRLNVSTFCGIRWVHHFPPVY